MLTEMAPLILQAITITNSSNIFIINRFRNYGGYDGSGAGHQRKNLYEEEVEIDTGAYNPTYEEPVVDSS
jgi:hypothetical protein